ncbi:dsRBD fold-containing protein [Streptomyces sp. NPDC059533]|uniref:dsRBD fold-containing protein n=1 Tax=unclassified Streptomyces TaxID=2593676 RepID=UPI0036C0194F
MSTDEDVPEIGDELAAARALENLAAQLRRIEYGDVTGAGAAPERGSLKPYGGWMDGEVVQ